MSITLDVRVVELLASRVCHDLISPIGAVGNGLELLEDSKDDLADEALKLSMNCVRRASALLEFFRMAYGAAGSGTGVSWEAARGLASGVLEATKAKLDWKPVPAGKPLPTGSGKLALNLAMLASEALPRGGDIVVALVPSGAGMTLSATATGRDAKLSDEVAKALAAGPAAVAGLTAKSVHGYFTGRLAEAYGGRLDVTAPTPGSVRMSVVLPAAA